MMQSKDSGGAFPKHEVGVLCISTLGDKRLLNVCSIGKVYNKNRTRRVECGPSTWDGEKFNRNEGYREKGRNAKVLDKGRLATQAGSRQFWCRWRTPHRVSRADPAELSGKGRQVTSSRSHP